MLALYDMLLADKEAGQLLQQASVLLHHRHHSLKASGKQYRRGVVYLSSRRQCRHFRLTGTCLYQ